MRKNITRDLVFTRTEVRDAIIRMLSDRDHPYPNDPEKAKFTLGTDGASLYWSEEIEST